MKDHMCEEPMCETSERGEKLIARDEILPLSLEIGRRMIINGDDLPSTELLLGLHKTTGVSFDWLVTGTGAKFTAPLQISDHSRMSSPAALRSSRVGLHDGQREINAAQKKTKTIEIVRSTM